MSALFWNPEYFMEQFTTPINSNLLLTQQKNMLTYGTDAYLLYAFLRSKSAGKAVELGSGSGVISLLAVSSNKYQHITAIDVQPSQAELTQSNAAANQLDDRIHAICANVKELTPVMIGGEVDAVFSNPPYMTIGSGKANLDSAKYIARHEVLGTIGDFCMAASRLLKFGGSFYVVWRPDRLPALFTALDHAKLTPKRMITVCADAKHSPSLVLLEAKKGGSPDGFFLTRPLFLHNDAKASTLENTPDCTYIYQNGDFPNEYIRP